MEHMKKLQQIILVLLSLYNCCQGQSIDGPNDVTIRNGRNVFLPCHVSGMRDGIQFAWSIIGLNSKDIYIYQNGFGHLVDPNSGYKYEVSKSDADKGIFDLQIKDLDWSDGGKYQCSIHGTGIYETALADLVVMDMPILSQTPRDPREGEKCAFSCTVSFGSPGIENMTESHFPYLQMFYQGNLLTDGDYTELPSSPDISWSSIEELHNVSVSWEYDNQDLQCVATTDFPLFSLETIFKVSVIHGVRDMTFKPHLETYFVDDVITCEVSGNPEPWFLWQPLHDGSIGSVNSPELRLGVNLVGNNRWRCTANNTIDGKQFEISSTIDFNVVLQSTPSSPMVPTQDTVTEAGSGCHLTASVLTTLVLFFCSHPWRDL